MKYVPFKQLLVVLAVGIFLTACNTHGEKVSKGHVDVYYKEGINKELADKTADLLYGIDKAYNNHTSETKSFQILKQNDTITFKMVVVQEKLAGIEDESFYAMGNIISDSIFQHAPVNVDLTDNKFKTLRTLHYKDMNLDEVSPNE